MKLFVKIFKSVFLISSTIIVASCGETEDSGNSPNNNTSGIIEFVKDDVSLPKNLIEDGNSIEILDVKNTSNQSVKGTNSLGVVGKGKNVTISNISLTTSLSSDPTKDGARLLSSSETEDLFSNPCEEGLVLKPEDTCQIAVEFIGEDIKNNVENFVSDIIVETKENNKVEIKRKVNFDIPQSDSLVKVNVNYVDSQGFDISPKIISGGNFDIKIENIGDKDLNYPHLVIPKWVSDLVDYDKSKIKYLGDVNPGNVITFSLYFKKFEVNNNKSLNNLLTSFNDEIPNKLKELSFYVSAGNIKNNHIIPINIGDISNDLIFNVNNPNEPGQFTARFENKSSYGLYLDNVQYSFPNGVSVINNSCNDIDLINKEICSILLEATENAYGSGQITVDYRNPNDIDSNGVIKTNILSAPISIPKVSLSLKLNDFDANFLKAPIKVQNIGVFNSQDEIKLILKDSTNEEVDSTLYNITENNQDNNICSQLQSNQVCSKVLELSPNLSLGNYNLVPILNNENKSLNTILPEAIAFSNKKKIELVLSVDGTLYQGEQNSILDIKNISPFNFSVENILANFKIIKNNQESSGISLLNSNTCNYIGAGDICNFKINVSPNAELGEYTILYNSSDKNLTVKKITVTVNKPGTNIAISNESTLGDNIPKGINSNVSWKITNNSANKVTIKSIEFPQNINNNFNFTLAEDNTCTLNSYIGQGAKNNNCLFSVNIMPNESSTQSESLKGEIILNFEDDNKKLITEKFDINTFVCMSGLSLTVQKTVNGETTISNNIDIYPGAENNIILKSFLTKPNNNCNTYNPNFNIANWLSPYVEISKIPSEIVLGEEINLTLNIDEKLDLLKYSQEYINNPHDEDGKILTLISSNAETLKGNLNIIDGYVDFYNTGDKKITEIIGLNSISQEAVKLINKSDYLNYDMKILSTPKWLVITKESTCFEVLDKNSSCFIYLKANENSKNDKLVYEISNDTVGYNETISLDVQSLPVLLSITDENLLVTGRDATFNVKIDTGVYTFTDDDFVIENANGDKVEGLTLNYDTCAEKTLTPTEGKDSCNIIIDAKNYVIEDGFETLNLKINNDKVVLNYQFDVLSSNYDLNIDSSQNGENLIINLINLSSLGRVVINKMSLTGDTESYTTEYADCQQVTLGKNQSCLISVLLKDNLTKVPTNETFVINYSIINDKLQKVHIGSTLINVNGDNIFSWIDKNNNKIFEYKDSKIEGTGIIANKLLGLTKYGEYIYSVNNTELYFGNLVAKVKNPNNELLVKKSSNEVLGYSFESSTIITTGYSVSGESINVADNNRYDADESISSIYLVIDNMINYINSQNHYKYLLMSEGSGKTNKSEYKVYNYFNIDSDSVIIFDSFNEDIAGAVYENMNGDISGDNLKYATGSIINPISLLTYKSSIPLKYQNSNNNSSYDVTGTNHRPTSFVLVASDIYHSNNNFQALDIGLSFAPNNHNITINVTTIMNDKVSTFKAIELFKRENFENDFIYAIGYNQNNEIILAKIYCGSYGIYYYSFINYSMNISLNIEEVFNFGKIDTKLPDSLKGLDIVEDVLLFTRYNVDIQH